MRLLPLALALACSLPLAAQECPPNQPPPNQPQPGPNQPEPTPDQGGRTRPDAGDSSLHHDTDWSRPWLTDPDASEHRTPSEADDDLDAYLWLARNSDPSPLAKQGGWMTSGAWFARGGRDFPWPTGIGDMARDAFRDCPVLKELYEFWLRIIRMRIRRLRHKAKETTGGDPPGGDTTTGGGDTTTGGDGYDLDSLLAVERLILDLLGRGEETGGDGGGTDPTLDDYLNLAKKIHEEAEKSRGYRDHHVTDPEEKKMYDGYIDDMERSAAQLQAAAGQEFGDDEVTGWAGWGR